MTAFGSELHESVNVPPNCGSLLGLRPIFALIKIDSKVPERLPTAPLRRDPDRWKGFGPRVNRMFSSLRPSPSGDGVADIKMTQEKLRPPPQALPVLSPKIWQTKGPSP